MIVLHEVAFIDDVAAVDIAPQPGTDVVVNMISAESDPIAQGNLHAAGFPSIVEAVDVVRPDPVILDLDISTMACDAGLAVVMNVTVAHAAAGSDADPGP